MQRLQPGLYTAHRSILRRMLYGSAEKSPDSCPHLYQCIGVLSVASRGWSLGYLFIGLPYYKKKKMHPCEGFNNYLTKRPSEPACPQRPKMYAVLLALLVFKLGPAKASHISLFGLLTNGLGGGG